MKVCVRMRRATPCDRRRANDIAVIVVDSPNARIIRVSGMHENNYFEVSGIQSGMMCAYKQFWRSYKSKLHRACSMRPCCILSHVRTCVWPCVADDPTLSSVGEEPRQASDHPRYRYEIYTAVVDELRPHERRWGLTYFVFCLSNYVLYFEILFQLIGVG